MLDSNPCSHSAINVSVPWRSITVRLDTQCELNAPLTRYYGPDGYYPHAGLVRRWSNWCRVVASMIALAWANRKTLLPRFAKWRTDVLHMKQNSLGGELESYRLPTLVCTSPLVFPPAPDFKPEVFVPGFLFLDAAQADRQEAATTAATASVDARHTTAAGAGAGAGASAALLLPPELAAFLERCGDSDRPVCVNFGSMIAGGGRAGFIADIVCAVVHDLGLPCVLIAGWNTFDEATAARMNGRPAGGSGSSGSATHPRLCCVRSVPHEAIFPRCAAVVHHGGSGTTARVLLSGVPSVVIPILHWSDQPQFGIATQRLGVGVCIREQATRARVVAAVRQVVPEDEAQREAVLVRCRAVAARMEGEDGVVGAAEALSHCLCAAVKPKTAADVRFLKRHCVPCTMRERGVKNDSGGVGGGDGDKPGWVRYRVQQGMWESMGLCVKLLLLVLVLGTAWMWLRHR